MRHSPIHDVHFNTFHRVDWSPHLEIGSGWGLGSSRTQAADILITNWENGTSAAVDVTVTSALNYTIIMQVDMYSGVTARTGEFHSENDTKYRELG